MPDKSAEVKRYTSAVDRIIERWQQETQLKLSGDLDSIAKEIGELGKLKQPSPEDKKRILKLKQESCDVAKKCLTEKINLLNQNLQQLKQPDLQKERDLGSVQEKLDDLQDEMERYNKELKEDGVELQFNDKLKAKLPFLDDLKLTVDADKNGVNSVKANYPLFRF